MAGVSARTLGDFEVNGSDPRSSTVQKLWRALEAADNGSIDADDVDGRGVRLGGGHEGEALRASAADPERGTNLPTSLADHFRFH